MHIERLLQALIAVLFLAAILCPVDAFLSDNSTIITPSESTILVRNRRHIQPDPLSNPWLHTKQELLQILWKKSGVGGGVGDSKYGAPIDCCPSVLEMVEPNGGTNLNGTYVQLYQDGDVKQRFYELSCERNIEGRPCRFMDRKLHNMSKCVQKYSYSYALVREQFTSTVYNSDSGGMTEATTGGGGGGASLASRHHHHSHRSSHRHSASFHTVNNSDGGDASGNGPRSGWMLDYIRVRSGCSCEVTPKIKKKRNSNNNANNPQHKLKKNKLKKHNHFNLDYINNDD